jgi:xanthosine utilization system XapX-like protein
MIGGFDGDKIRIRTGALLVLFLTLVSLVEWHYQATGVHEYGPHTGRAASLEIGPDGRWDVIPRVRTIHFVFSWMGLMGLACGGFVGAHYLGKRAVANKGQLLTAIGAALMGLLVGGIYAARIWPVSKVPMIALLGILVGVFVVVRLVESVLGVFERNRNLMTITGIVFLVVCLICLIVATIEYQRMASYLRALHAAIGGRSGVLEGVMYPAVAHRVLFALAFGGIGALLMAKRRQART